MERGAAPSGSTTVDDGRLELRIGPIGRFVVQEKPGKPADQAKF